MCDDEKTNYRALQINTALCPDGLASCTQRCIIAITLRKDTNEQENRKGKHQTCSKSQDEDGLLWTGL